MLHSRNLLTLSLFDVVYPEEKRSPSKAAATKTAK